MRPIAKMPPLKYSTTTLGGGSTSQGISYPGGLDQTTPILRLNPGSLRDVVNFECLQSGGYGRIAGYERFDGRPSPSAAIYTLVQVSSFTNVPTVSQTITQAASGATGVIAAVNNVSGAYYVILTKVTGTFDSTHALTVGATPIGTAITQTATLTSKQQAQYIAAAADIYRADIGAVPGSGHILGVVGMTFSGVDYVFAFRNNVGGTAAALYKSTSSGWVNVPFYKTVSFTGGGTATPADGATLTQGGVTATVKRVVWRTGAWTGSAAGAFVIATPSGGSFAAGAATLTGGATVTLSGAETQITMLPGGRFEFDKANFTGTSTTSRIYGCDGVNPAFEFDGDVLVPILTGASNDKPRHINAHKNLLFVSIDSSILYSVAGYPFRWSSVDGAGEIATGDNVTGLLTMPGAQTTAALAVFQRSNTSILYGTDPTTFNYVTYNTGIGGFDYTQQNMFDAFTFDNMGVVTLQTSLNYGNFSSATLTKNILPFIQSERTKITCSCLNRDRSQYRVFFSDGFGLWLTVVNSQYMGASVVYFPNPVFVADEADLASGDHVTYFGSNDSSGYVYRMDTGTSFDGSNIDAHATLAWDAQKSHRIIKQYRALSVEVQGNGYAEFQVGYSLGYGSTDISQPVPVTYTSNFSGAPTWDSFTWDNFVWDGQTLFPTEADMTGDAENVQVTIQSTGNYIAAYQLNSITYHYTQRRSMR
jgi:hypothetical protein